MSLSLSPPVAPKADEETFSHPLASGERPPPSPHPTCAPMLDVDAVALPVRPPDVSLRTPSASSRASEAPLASSVGSSPPLSPSSFATGEYVCRVCDAPVQISETRADRREVWQQHCLTASHQRRLLEEATRASPSRRGTQTPGGSTIIVHTTPTPTPPKRRHDDAHHVTQPATPQTSSPHTPRSQRALTHVDRYDDGVPLRWVSPQGSATASDGVDARCPPSPPRRAPLPGRAASPTKAHIADDHVDAQNTARTPSGTATSVSAPPAPEAKGHVSFAPTPQQNRERERQLNDLLFQKETAQLRECLHRWYAAMFVERTAPLDEEKDGSVVGAGFSQHQPSPCSSGHVPASPPLRRYPSANPVPTSPAPQSPRSHAAQRRLELQDTSRSGSGSGGSSSSPDHETTPALTRNSSTPHGAAPSPIAASSVSHPSVLEEEENDLCSGTHHATSSPVRDPPVSSAGKDACPQAQSGTRPASGPLQVSPERARSPTLRPTRRSSSASTASTDPAPPPARRTQSAHTPPSSSHADGLMIRSRAQRYVGVPVYPADPHSPSRDVEVSRVEVEWRVALKLQRNTEDDAHKPTIPSAKKTDARRETSPRAHGQRRPHQADAQPTVVAPLVDPVENADQHKTKSRKRRKNHTPLEPVPVVSEARADRHLETPPSPALSASDAWDAAEMDTEAASDLSGSYDADGSNYPADSAYTANGDRDGDELCGEEADEDGDQGEATGDSGTSADAFTDEDVGDDEKGMDAPPAHPAPQGNNSAVPHRRRRAHRPQSGSGTNGDDNRAPQPSQSGEPEALDSQPRTAAEVPSLVSPSLAITPDPTHPLAGTRCSPASSQPLETFQAPHAQKRDDVEHGASASPRSTGSPTPPANPSSPTLGETAVQAKVSPPSSSRPSASNVSSPSGGCDLEAGEDGHACEERAGGAPAHGAGSQPSTTATDEPPRQHRPRRRARGGRRRGGTEKPADAEQAQGGDAIPGADSADAGVVTIAHNQGTFAELSATETTDSESLIVEGEATQVMLNPTGARRPRRRPQQSRRPERDEDLADPRTTDSSPHGSTRARETAEASSTPSREDDDQGISPLTGYCARRDTAHAPYGLAGKRPQSTAARADRDDDDDGAEAPHEPFEDTDGDQWTSPLLARSHGPTFAPLQSPVDETLPALVSGRAATSPAQLRPDTPNMLIEVDDHNDGRHEGSPTISRHVPPCRRRRQRDHRPAAPTTEPTAVPTAEGRRASSKASEDSALTSVLSASVSSQDALSEDAQQLPPSRQPLLQATHRPEGPTATAPTCPSLHDTDTDDAEQMARLLQLLSPAMRRRVRSALAAPLADPGAHAASEPHTPRPLPLHVSPLRTFSSARASPAHRGSPTATRVPGLMATPPRALMQESGRLPDNGPHFSRSPLCGVLSSEQRVSPRPARASLSVHSDHFPLSTSRLDRLQHDAAEELSQSLSHTPIPLWPDTPVGSSSSLPLAATSAASSGIGFTVEPTTTAVEAHPARVSRDGRTAHGDPSPSNLRSRDPIVEDDADASDAPERRESDARPAAGTATATVAPSPQWDHPLVDPAGIVPARPAGAAHPYGGPITTLEPHPNARLDSAVKGMDAEPQDCTRLSTAAVPVPISEQTAPPTEALPPRAKYLARYPTPCPAAAPHPPTSSLSDRPMRPPVTVETSSHSSDSDRYRLRRFNADDEKDLVRVGPTGTSTRAAAATPEATRIPGHPYNVPSCSSSEAPSEPHAMDASQDMGPTQWETSPYTDKVAALEERVKAVEAAEERAAEMNTPIGTADEGDPAGVGGRESSEPTLVTDAAEMQNVNPPEAVFALRQDISSSQASHGAQPSSAERSSARLQPSPHSAFSSASQPSQPMPTSADVFLDATQRGAPVPFQEPNPDGLRTSPSHTSATNAHPDQQAGSENEIVDDGEATAVSEVSSHGAQRPENGAEAVAHRTPPRSPRPDRFAAKACDVPMMLPLMDNAILNSGNVGTPRRLPPGHRRHSPRPITPLQSSTPLAEETTSLLVTQTPAGTQTLQPQPSSGPRATPGIALNHRMNHSPCLDGAEREEALDGRAPPRDPSLPLEARHSPVRGGSHLDPTSGGRPRLGTPPNDANSDGDTSEAMRAPAIVLSPPPRPPQTSSAGGKPPMSALPAPAPATTAVSPPAPLCPSHAGSGTPTRDDAVDASGSPPGLPVPPRPHQTTVASSPDCEPAPELRPTHAQPPRPDAHGGDDQQTHPSRSGDDTRAQPRSQGALVGDEDAPAALPLLNRPSAPRPVNPTSSPRPSAHRDPTASEGDSDRSQPHLRLAQGVPVCPHTQAPVPREERSPPAHPTGTLSTTTAHALPPRKSSPLPLRRGPAQRADERAPAGQSQTRPVRADDARASPRTSAPVVRLTVLAPDGTPILIGEVPDPRLLAQDDVDHPNRRGVSAHGGAPASIRYPTQASATAHDAALVAAPPQYVIPRGGSRTTPRADGELSAAPSSSDGKATSGEGSGDGWLHSRTDAFATDPYAPSRSEKAAEREAVRQLDENSAVSGSSLYSSKPSSASLRPPSPRHHASEKTPASSPSHQLTAPQHRRGHGSPVQRQSQRPFSSTLLSSEKSNDAHAEDESKCMPRDDESRRRLDPARSARATTSAPVPAPVEVARAESGTYYIGGEDGRVYRLYEMTPPGPSALPQPPASRGHHRDPYDEAVPRSSLVPASGAAAVDGALPRAESTHPTLRDSSPPQPSYAHPERRASGPYGAISPSSSTSARHLSPYRTRLDDEPWSCPPPRWRSPSRAPLTVPVDPLGCGRFNPYCGTCRAKYNKVFVDDTNAPVRFPSSRSPELQRLGDCRYNRGLVFGGPEGHPLLTAASRSASASPSRQRRPPLTPTQRDRDRDYSAEEMAPLGRFMPVQFHRRPSPRMVSPQRPSSSRCEPQGEPVCASGDDRQGTAPLRTAQSSRQPTRSSPPHSDRSHCDAESDGGAMSHAAPGSSKPRCASPTAPPPLPPRPNDVDATRTPSTSAAASDASLTRHAPAAAFTAELSDASLTPSTSESVRSLRREERRLRKCMKQLLWHDLPDARDAAQWELYLESLTYGLDRMSALRQKRKLGEDS